MLIRIREVAVQMANGIYTDQDRSNGQAEITLLKEEIDKIAENLAFNEVKLLDGSYDSSFRTGVDNAEMVDLRIISQRAEELGKRAPGASEQVQATQAASNNGRTETSANTGTTRLDRTEGTITINATELSWVCGFIKCLHHGQFQLDHAMPDNSVLMPPRGRLPQHWIMKAWQTEMQTAFMPLMWCSLMAQTHLQKRCVCAPWTRRTRFPLSMTPLETARQ